METARPRGAWYGLHATKNEVSSNERMAIRDWKVLLSHVRKLTRTLNVRFENLNVVRPFFVDTMFLFLVDNCYCC